MAVFTFGIVSFAGVIFALILRRWQFGIIILFVWLFIGDSIRKLIPGQPVFIILISDAILFFTYFSFLTFNIIKRRVIWLPPFFLTFVLFSLSVLAGMFHPQVYNIMIGLIGFRSYLWFIPLLFLGYAYFKNSAEILRFTRRIVYLAIPLFLLAIVQLFFPNFDNPFFAPFLGGWRGHSFGIGGFGDVPKLPSFFGSDQRYGMVSVILFLLGLGLFYGDKSRAVVTSRKKENRLLLFFAIISAFGGTVMCGSRSAFILAVIGLILFFFLENGKKIQVKKIILWAFISLVLLYGLYKIGIAAGFSNMLAVVNVFNQRIPAYVSELKQIFSQFTLFGYGTGILSQGLTEIGEFKGNILRLAHSVAETGTRRVIVELGIAGFVLFCFLWGNIFVTMGKRLKAVRNSDMFPLALGIFLFPILILTRFIFVHHEVLGDWVVLIPLWFFIGVFFKMVKLETSQN